MAEAMRDPTPTTVGASERSIKKHKLLDKLVGKVAAVATTPKYRIQSGNNRLVFFDLTAGDGSPNPYSRTSSPAIFLKHADWVRVHGNGLAIRCVFVERDRTTFERLQCMVGDRPDVELVHGDASQPGMLPRVQANSSVFIFVDGNSVNQNPDLQLLRQMPKHTVLISTLGCNAHGIRRILPQDPDAIERWRLQVTTPLETMSLRHDALLIVPGRDSHMWAYLVVAPTVWKRGITAEAASVFGNRRGTMSWYRDDDGFRGLMSYLFAPPKHHESYDTPPLGLQWNVRN